MDDAELVAEQEYFDRALQALQRSDATRAGAASAAANPGAASRIAKLVRRKARGIDGVDGPVAFGRIDHVDGEALYIGGNLVRDDSGEVLVVNWTAPAAKPFYVATPADPAGLRRRRQYECQANTILSYADVLFDVLFDPLDRKFGGTDGQFSDALLAELDRARGPELRDIVATIHATQYELISAPLDEVLVVDGGPGTGKTVVALHRISWLLANHAERLRPDQVLVVGPNPTFVSYTELVLPSLGDVAVDQRDIGTLAPQVRRDRPEPDNLARLKGDARMAGLLARALDARIGTPEATERLSIGSGYLTLPGDEVSKALAQSRMADLPYAQRRTRLRESLYDLVAQRLDRPTPPGRIASLDNLVDRLWPQLTAPSFLADLYNSRRRLAAAGAGYLAEQEVSALHRRAADRISQQDWSDADLALLDEADWLINGRPEQTYAHVAVDEVQDLSAMQLRAVARRCPTGSMTLAGDLAQATGPAAAQSWAQVLEHLPARTPARVVALRYGYRVPREVYEFAAPLLPLCAPEATAPRPIRSGPAQPQVHRVTPESRMAEVVQVVQGHADAGRFIGVICPSAQREELAAHLDRGLVDWHDADRGELGERVNVISPRGAKGLEFDAVVVVEPEEIVATEGYGHRLLYVAFTRTTGYLDVVCVGEPLPLTVPQPPESVAQVPAPRPSGETVAAFAREVAAGLRRSYPPELLLEILQMAAEELDGSQPGTGRHASRAAPAVEPP